MSRPDESAPAPEAEGTGARTSGDQDSGSGTGDAAARVQREQSVHRLLATLNGPVQFVSLVPRGNGGGPMRVAIFEVGDPAAVAFVARNDAEGRASYYSLNIVQPGLTRKATKADITAARGLHVDIDPPKDGSPFDREAVLAKLHELPSRPSYIVDSGGGLQPVWLFDEPVTDLALAEGINRRLAKMLDGDHCFNIDRLLRVPGSLNTPDTKKAEAGRVPTRARFVA